MFLLLFQCRKYKGSDQIRKKAEYIYCKFKQLFVNGDGHVEGVSVTIRVPQPYLLTKQPMID